MKFTNIVDSSVVDALTGAPMDFNHSTWICDNCKCRYGAESMEVIAQENAGKCISCGSKNIRCNICGVEYHGTEDCEGCENNVAEYRY